MKPGVWALDADVSGDCKFNVAKPIEQWPECASGAIVGATSIGGYDHRDGKAIWTEEPFVLVAGDPRVGQMRFQETVKSGSSESGTTLYGYLGIRPTKTDAQGRITAITYWIAQCGPPAPPPKDNEPPDFGTKSPLPGMVMAKGSSQCSTTSQDALRNAARASEAWADKPMHAHWLRDGK